MYQILCHVFGVGGSLSKVCEDEALDREIEKAEIVKCICKHNNKTGGSDDLDYNYYGENACPGPKPNSSGWDLGQDGKLWNGRNGRSGKLSHSSDVIGACIF